MCSEWVIQGSELPLVIFKGEKHENQTTTAEKTVNKNDVEETCLYRSLKLMET